MATQTTTRPPSPPFTHESAIQKVRLTEDGWNTRDRPIDSSPRFWFNRTVC
jgi:nuclear transport factor 2 (NTF2) superfamily protein